jgi:hypothetical protein
MTIKFSSHLRQKDAGKQTQWSPKVGAFHRETLEDDHGEYVRIFGGEDALQAVESAPCTAAPEIEHRVVCWVHLTLKLLQQTLSDKN